METLRQRFSARSRADSVPIKGGPRRDGEAEERGKRGRSGGGKHGDGILNRNIRRLRLSALSGSYEHLEVECRRI